MELSGLDSDDVVRVLAAAKTARQAAEQARQGPAGRGPARAEGRSAGPRPAAAGAAAFALSAPPAPGLPEAAQRPSWYLTNSLSAGENDAGQEPFPADRQEAQERPPRDLLETAADQVYNARRALRYALREVLWRESMLRRVRSCGRSRIDKDAPVKVRVQDGHSHYTNLQVCGSIWACPVCSAKIRNSRSEEITAAAVAHLEAGGEIWMATFTARHKKRHRLAPLMKAIAEGFSSMLAGDAGKAERTKGVPLVDADGVPLTELLDGDGGLPLEIARETGPLLGTIRSAEVTWSSANGWHPHLHVLVFMTPGHTPEQLAKLMDRWNKQWIKWMTKRGFAPTVEHGHKWVKVYSAQEAAEYVAKTQDGKHVGNEMARGDLKTGRMGSVTPFQLLEYLNATGDADALPLWHEYELATKGKKAITWSHGLRKTLLDDDDDPDDQDLAEAEVGGQDVAEIPTETWKVICLTRGLPAKVLRAAETGGLPAINGLLAPYGVSAEPPADPPRTEHG